MRQARYSGGRQLDPGLVTSTLLCSLRDSVRDTMHQEKRPGATGDLLARIHWLLLLRWFAAAGLLIAITGTRFVLHVDVPLVPLYAANLALVLMNACYTLFQGALRKRAAAMRAAVPAAFLANLQISLDLALLTWLIHFTGGIENPVIFFYTFHMVIASILLSNRDAYLQAAFASAVFGLVMAAEQAGLIPRHGIDPLVARASPAVSWPDFIARSGALIATLFIIVYMSTSIVNRLRERERELENANRKLLDADRIKSRYVMTVSHDIRGSIGAVQSCLLHESLRNSLVGCCTIPESIFILTGNTCVNGIRCNSIFCIFNRFCWVKDILMLCVPCQIIEVFRTKIDRFGRAV